MRATYNRYQGVEYFLGFYDVHRGIVGGIFRKRKRVREIAEAFQRLRRCYPTQRLYVVLDNLPNVHDHPRFVRLLERLRITPVFTPTNASWLNLIEPQFGVLQRRTLADTDDPTHVIRRRRIYRFLRYRAKDRGVAGHPLTRMHLLRGIKLGQH